MGGWLYVLYLLLPAFGLPVLAVGVVLRLCEWSWGKRAGDLGSLGPLAAGAVLSLPLVPILVALARDRLAR
jgi:hypothetical protein